MDHASNVWECQICSNENPAYALFCQNSSCKCVQGSWQCKACGYLVTRVEGVSLPDRIETCPNCGAHH